VILNLKGCVSASFRNFAAASATVVCALVGRTDPAASISATLCAAIRQFAVPREQRRSLPFRWPFSHKGHFLRCLEGQGFDSETSPHPFRCLWTIRSMAPKPLTEVMP
jgi:hypothetical protein